MKWELKLKIVFIFSILFATCLKVSATDYNLPQQSITQATPPEAVILRDIQKEYMRIGVPPVAPVEISGVPDYLWRHGCGPTAVGNVIGYYDSHGYDDLIKGDANTQTYDTNQAMASGGDSGNPNPPGSERHYEDYARPEDSSPGPILNDDYITQGRIPHKNDCIGDYQDTSKSTRNNYYGWSWSTDLGPSFTNYVNHKNGGYHPNFTEYSPVSGRALTWAVLTNEINNNHPMVFLVDSDGDGSTDHFVAVVGYDAATNQYGCHDSWMPAGTRWETFQQIGNGPFSIWGGWALHLGNQPVLVAKWEQLPNTTPYGMDVRCDRRLSQQRILADDFQCTTSGPITKIKLWGSWKGDSKGLIKTIHLNIYSDDPIGPGGPDPCNTYSKPGQRLWSKDINSPNFTETLFYDLMQDYEYWYNPPSQLIPNGDHRIWQYDIPIDPCIAFVQQGSGTAPVIYWLGAYAIIDSNSPTDANFGWKTSGDTTHRLDDAAWSNNDGNNWMEMRYPSGHPLYPNSVDLAFGIYTTSTEPNVEPNYPNNAKWLQTPDLSTNGLDVKAIDPVILADDFLCNQSTLITDITIWGSWDYDMLPQEGVNNVPFTLSIHSDLPANLSQSGYSMPNDVLWQRVLLPTSVSIQRQDINEGWFEPSYYQYIFPADHVCWKYVFHIPDANAFCQKGDPNHPVVYWLDVQAHPSPTSGAQFGWKTSTDHWNDDAVWTSGVEPYMGSWQELKYPSQHPLYPESIDLAFAIEGNTPCNQPQPQHDLGDAPDSSNNYAVNMTAYPGVTAHYPTVYLTGSPPYGPIHWLPMAQAWLGQSVTLENEADIGPDQDGTNNIDPNRDKADMDKGDDGVLNMPLTLRYCLPTTFTYQINNAVVPNITLYTNVWFDWNRDGDWDDTPVGCGNEWAVQNQAIPAGSLALGLNTMTTPAFLPYHPDMNERKIWMRITLSEQPWVAGNGSGGAGPVNGYYYGETEDYYFAPDANCLYVGRVFNVDCCSLPVNLNITAPMVSKWLYLGKPKCWCCDAQKCGNGIYSPAATLNRVDITDLSALQGCYLKQYTQPGYCPCLDFNLSGRIDVTDLSILQLHYLKRVGSSCCL